VRAIRFDHIAIGLPKIADAAPVLVGALGGVPDAGNTRASRGFRWGCWRYAGGGRLEVLEPHGTEGFLHRFLAERGPGIHHVTFQVPSLVEACGRAEALGYKIVGFDDANPAWKEAFLHPKQALGIVVQFAETAGGTDPRRWRPPATVANPPAPVTVRGLRMRVGDAERARVQWGEILQGTCVSRSADQRDLDRDGASPSVVYRWPDSPMVITVDVDPTGAEGPVAIELASPRRLVLPDGPVRDLGTTFRFAGP